MKLTALLLLASCAAYAATEENLNMTFPTSPGGTLVVDVDFGSIDVGSNTVSDKVGVEVWRRVTRGNKAEEEQFLRETPVVFEREGDAFVIRSRTRQQTRWWGVWRNRNEARYRIRVPSQFGVKLNTSGGGIVVSNLTGEVKANTSGGGLRFTNLRGPLNGNTSGGGIRVADCEGTIKVDTSGGGIEVTGGGGSFNGATSGGGVSVKTFNGPVSVGTSGGGMTIENVNGKVQASTSGGPINAVLLSPLPGDVALSTSGGGVTVKVPGNAAFNLDAEASGGGVTCDLPVSVQGKVERSHMKGVVNGGGPAIRLRTGGGGIRVKKL